ncbi:hypothetical protein OG369_35675 [Streptomyces sp. NBC_01221]|uniref:hypothetical protein n=1 Tax=unclassified Streptomyces TaxID=2593676 RepID=UPI002256807E|nr:MULTISPECIES: hypothetical protein [unclassified Streptomyces]MCX4791299.1 hypothetical protein [Streptomyces sp. NBC_01221]MCX4792992.1 hypothetical protein [Streptomyces sp. NBC_01242]WSP59515.1 hypothetical protein OG306_37925 [Streptomyces sp. NBC_01241]WSU19969.1 hypothetical protein OG508_02455 [Streptomyces sp. NBC_01108]
MRRGLRVTGATGRDSDQQEAQRFAAVDRQVRDHVHGHQQRRKPPDPRSLAATPRMPPRQALARSRTSITGM